MSSWSGIIAGLEAKTVSLSASFSEASTKTTDMMSEKIRDLRESVEQEIFKMRDLKFLTSSVMKQLKTVSCFDITSWFELELNVVSNRTLRVLLNYPVRLRNQ